MSQSPQGWYEDDDAPGLARWWDGERWTEHTMVLPAAPGAVEDDEDDLGYFSLPSDDLDPLPPRTGPSRFPRPDDDELPSAAATNRLDPTVVGALGVGAFGELDDSDNPFFAPEPTVEPGVYRPDWLGAEVPPRHRAASTGGAGDRFARRYRAWPLWARILAPVLALALMVGLAVAAAGSTSSGNGSTTTTVATVPSSTTTAVTFVPLASSSSVVPDSSVPPSSTTSTTARRSVAPTSTAKPTTTTITTAVSTTTSTTTASTTSTSTTEP